MNSLYNKLIKSIDKGIFNAINESQTTGFDENNFNKICDLLETYLNHEASYKNEYFNLNKNIIEFVEQATNEKNLSNYIDDVTFSDLIISIIDKKPIYIKDALARNEALNCLYCILNQISLSIHSYSYEFPLTVQDLYNAYMYVFDKSLPVATDRSAKLAKQCQEVSNLIYQFFGPYIKKYKFASESNDKNIYKPVYGSNYEVFLTLDNISFRASAKHKWFGLYDRQSNAGLASQFANCLRRINGIIINAGGRFGSMKFDPDLDGTYHITFFNFPKLLDYPTIKITSYNRPQSKIILTAPEMFIKPFIKKYNL